MSITSSGSSPGLKGQMGMRLSTGGDQNQTSFYQSKEEIHYNLYCINIRSNHKKNDPSLSIRKLNGIDNLMAIEKQNTAL